MPWNIGCIREAAWNGLPICQICTSYFVSVGVPAFAGIPPKSAIRNWNNTFLLHVRPFKLYTYARVSANYVQSTAASYLLQMMDILKASLFSFCRLHHNIFLLCSCLVSPFISEICWRTSQQILKFSVCRHQCISNPSCVLNLNKNYYYYY